MDILPAEAAVDPAAAAYEMTTDGGSLTPADFRQLESQGISEAEAQRQLALLSEPPQPAWALAPCVVGDGIQHLEEERHDLLEDRWRQMADASVLVKFVPASGAATRMFRDLRALLPHTRTASGGSSGESDSEIPRRFLDALPGLPFYQRLMKALAERGTDGERLLRQGDFTTLARALIDSEGLGYDHLPKALIEFHHYPAGSRTALEEHLIEGAGYLRWRAAPCRLHFTVSPEHRQAIAEHADDAAGRLESELEADFRIELSIQGSETDTLALGADGLPARRDDGSLLLRPSGHGALLSNLGRTGADIAVVKNIDNISPERLHPESVRWKRLLIGRFFELQTSVHTTLDRLTGSGCSEETVEQGFRLLEKSFAWKPPPGLSSKPPGDRRRYLLERLDRPLRVCGVVPNRGEPGGGPFWVRSRDGSEAGQILERAQLDDADPRVRRVLTEATHFNPVDLVCGLRDRRGETYRLNRFTDPRAVLVADKSHQGRPIRALERPGLWNGSMAGWNTCFVEVPLATFTPVKTLFDLLRPDHQV